MRRSLLVAVQALACLVMPRPAYTAFSRCLVFAGTADALGKSNAVDESQKSLRSAIDKWKADNGITGPVSETAEKPQPRPYWRGEVDPRLLLPPDVVTDASYTLLLEGHSVTWFARPAPGSAGDACLNRSPRSVPSSSS